MINNIKMNNGMNVVVDKGELKVSPYEIQEHLEELFEYKKIYKKSEVIKLSSICDCLWDIMFCSINKESKEMSFKLC